MISNAIILKNAS